MQNNKIMKMLKALVYIIVSLMLLSVPLQRLFAQGMEDPTTWTYEVKKKTATEYDVIFHVTLKEGWHIWSLKPGGDGFEIAPSFTFDRNEKIQLKGKLKEQGKLVTQKVEGMPKPLAFYNERADFVQTIVIKNGELKQVTGVQQYQVCNEQMCLPPKTKKFVIEIKG